MRGPFLVSTLIFFCLTLLFYKGAGSVSYPKIIILNSISTKYTPVRFNHERHIQFAQGCSQCHHEHQKNEALSCRDCHNITPSLFKNSVHRNFTACRNCHSEFNPSMPQMPDLKAAYHRVCFQCHKGMDVGTDPKGCTQRCHILKIEKAERRSP